MTDLSKTNAESTAWLGDKPVGNWQGFKAYWQSDLMSGLMVFLLALPLCLGISVASGVPPVAGVFTAIIGGGIGTLFSNSELTIKGPAAGLIVIVLGCIEAFGGDGMTGGWTEIDTNAYRAALAVGFAAAIIQIGFGLVRAGIVGEFFPVAAIHGMLAAIGLIIISKQIPVALGLSVNGEPLDLIRRIPEFIVEANPVIALIGMLSILVMFLWPLVGKKFPALRRIPSPMVVLALTVPLGWFFDLLHQHSYFLHNHEYQLSEKYLVAVPEKIFGVFSNIQTPDFTVLQQPIAWKWVALFFIIGSLESILSAKAVDLLDPWKRRSDMDRDIIAVGAGNVLSSLVGGLPMISEIVRSKANIDNGGKTRFANFWHGIFLLACVSLLPMLLHQIPLAALAGMLVYTGFRLAHPQEFINVFKIGLDQLAIFVVTLVAVLATDLLIGIAIGIGLKFLMHLAQGVPLRTLFFPALNVEPIDGHSVRIAAGESLVFSNWIAVRRTIEIAGLNQGKSVLLDLTKTKMVDHSVMEKLHHLEDDFRLQGLQLELLGLDQLEPMTSHHLASRNRRPATAQRLTVIGDLSLEDEIADILEDGGVSAFTASRCWDRHIGPKANAEGRELLRIEAVASHEAMRQILQRINAAASRGHQLRAYLETVYIPLLANKRDDSHS